jgi:D-serine deaminase-like pyridoxal phosphate-dependent protein
MRRRALLIGGVGALGAAALLRPSDRGGPHLPAFEALQRELQQHAPGRTVVLVDRDRLRANAAKVKAQLPPQQAFRVVVKSLPALELLREVMTLMGTTRLMAFHAPHLPALAAAFPQSDVLLGKPMPVSAVACFYRDAPPGPFDAQKQVAWLVDSEARLREYQALAHGKSLRLRVSLELDVGLHRGGLASTEQLAPLLQLIAADEEHLELAGLMGYDAHVGGIPPVVERREVSLSAAFAAYDSFRSEEHTSELQSQSS